MEFVKAFDNRAFIFYYKYRKLEIQEKLAFSVSGGRQREYEERGMKRGENSIGKGRGKVRENSEIGVHSPPPSWEVIQIYCE